VCQELLWDNMGAYCRTPYMLCVAYIQAHVTYISRAAARRIFARIYFP